MDMLTRYEEYKSSDPTVGYHMGHLRGFFKDVRISQINNQLLREYAKDRTKKVRPSTVRRELDTLSASLGFAKKEGYISETPHIEKPPASPPRERWLTHEEFSKLLAASSGNLSVYLQIAINTAARPSAIYALKWFQVDMKRRIIHFNPEGRLQTKKYRPSVSINHYLYPVLKDARGESEYVLGGVKSLKKSFAIACKAAHLKGVTPYTLRHTAITWAVQGGHSLANIGQVAGHRDPRTTLRYAKHDPSSTRAVTDTLATGQELAKKRSKNVKKRQSRLKKSV